MSAAIRLEYRHESPAGSPRPVNLLFVHGISVGAWVWAEHFLSHFAGRGYNSLAVSLRGHGGSSGRERLHSFYLRDFADDIETAMGTLTGPTVLIGHSMGGGVAQYYLRRGGRAAGLALMSSVPPFGLAWASATMAIQQPALWRELSQLQSGLSANIGVLEQSLFSAKFSRRERRRIMPRFDEPAMRVSVELSAWKRIAPIPWFAPPVFVIGGENDRFIPPSEVALTAAYYSVRSHIIPGASHVMMVGPEWRAPADALDGWLGKTFG
ncbi:MAG: alpha/beta hydrolase [Hyphomicrobiales bacterium]|nr:alpha/beta hydrolase [Hyphomicrobiales bacterium]